jgi:hypothetical protein
MCRRLFVRGVEELFKHCVVMNSSETQTDPVSLVEALPFSVNGRSCTTCVGKCTCFVYEDYSDSNLLK